MTVKKDLFLATLSLDAYNQGYGERIEHGETVIGSASVGWASAHTSCMCGTFTL